MNNSPMYLRWKFWITDFLKGSPIAKPYREIGRILYCGNKCLIDNKLNELLAYAQQYSQYYSNYNSFNLQDYPVMNKSLLIVNAAAIRIPDKFIPGQKGDVFMQRTSGSTGTPLAVPQDTRKRLRRIADLKYFNQLVGFKSHAPLIQLRIWNQWQSKSPKQIKRENIYPFDCTDLSNDHLKELCELMIETKCVAMRGYASCFDLLAKYVMAHPQYKFPYLKIIISGSESLGDDTRANVKKYLGCDIISQYANEECGIMAQERIPTKEEGNVMYLNNADYIFEFLKLYNDEPANYGELARIVITDLHNYAFPMIRYDCGDVGIVAPPNQYSNGFPVLSKLYGRRMDVCLTTKGEPFSPMTIGRTVKHYDKIQQWQFVQENEKTYVLKLILNDCDDAAQYMQSVIEFLRESLGADADIKIESVTDISVLKSGKRKTIVNKWRKL